MKKINLISRLLSYSHEKQTPQRFGRYAAMLIMLLTLGVGQMWGNSGGFYNASMSYKFEDAEWAWIEDSDNGTGQSVTLGTLSSGSLIVGDVYLKCWDDWGDGNFKSGGGQMCYTNKGGSTQYLTGFTRSSKNGNNYDYHKTSCNLTIASATDASGSYALVCWYQTWGADNDNTGYGGSLWGDKYFPTSSGNYTINYKIAPPAVSGFTITPSGAGYVSGTGTSEDPYIMKHDAGNLVLTISGSQAHTDANSSAKYYTGSDWGNTATKTINYINGSTTKQSVTLKMKYTNSTASLDGAVSSITVYYQRENAYTVSKYSGGSVTGGSFTATSPAGAVSGGAVTATPSTGYNFSGWSVSSGSGTWKSSTSTASNTFYPAENSTVRASFTAKNYTVKLDKNSGDSNGTVQTTYNSNSTSSFTGASRTGYSCDGYFTAKTSGSKILNADGTLVSSTVANYLSSGYWVGDTVTVLYAQWTESATNYTVTYGVKSDQTSLGTLSCATTIGGSSIDSGDEVAGGTGITFTAAPITGYEVDAWCSDAACKSPIAGAGYANTYATTVSANTTVYVKFKKKIYTITYSPSSAPTGCTYTTKPTTGTYGNTVTMVFTPSAGYSVSVSARDASSNVVSISNPSTNTYTFTQPASAVTVTVTATENKVTLSPSVNYDHGSSSYTASADNQIGVVTTSRIKCSKPNTDHYTFAGWTLTNLTVTSGTAATDTIIYVKVTTPGSAIAAVANYNEVLTTNWKLIGDNQSGSPFGDNYAYASGKAMSKKSGYSTTSKAYKTIDVTKLPGDYYGFKVATAAGSSYGWGTSDGYYITYNRSKSGDANDVYTGDQHELKFVPDALGEYEFEVDYTSTPCSVKVTFPTAYAVTYNIGSVAGTSGSISATYSSVAFASGTKVQSGKSVTLTAPAAKTGYTWKGWYTNAAGTEGKIADTDRAITVTVNAAKTLYACYTENMTTVNLVASPTGKGTFTKGGAAVTSVSAGVTTKPAVTAVAATGYRVNTSATVWAKSNSNITLSSTTANPVTVTGCGTAATSSNLTATFTPKTYTITLHEQGATTSGTPGDGGTITATYDANTNLSTITALPARTGYTFGGYYDTPACDGTWIIKTDRYFNWDGTYINSSTGVWKYDGNVDLYAKWTANEYTVTFDVDEANKGTTASATTSQDIYYDDATVTVPNLPTAANGYKFDGYYTEQLGAGTKVINGDGTWIASVTGYTDADKKWVHADGVTLYAYYKKAEITALTLDATVVETNATVGLTPTISPTPEGNTKLCFYVFHGNDNPLDPQPEISWNGTKATFNAGETSGTYKIGVALRTGTECGGGTLLDSTTVSYQVAGTHSVTVRYKCGDEIIKAATTLEGIRPLDWSDKIGAPEITGYKFTGWTAGDGVTLTDDGGTTTATSSSEDTIKIKAIYDGYLTANYDKKRVIYFNNTLNWSSVYVYFYKNGSYWDEDKSTDRGTGCNKTYGFTDTPFEEGLYGQMLPVEEGSKIYYFDAEAAGVNASYQTVVFTELDQHTYDWFAKTGDVKNKVIKRDDYYSTKLPMYVPLAVQTPVSKNGNKADYYWQGYWMNYPENTGYTLKIYNQKAEYGAVELKSIPFEYTENKTMPMELNVDLEAGKTYGFKIWRNDGLNTGAGSFYGNTSTMTANTEGWDMKTTASSNTGLQTTASGNYKFLLNFYEVSSDYQYRVSVTYPVASGDYRLVYKDNVQTKEFKSAIIPKASAKDTVSFFVRKGQSANLKLQKCTGLGEGTVTWTDTVTWWSGSTIDAAVTQDSVYNICLKHNATTGELEIEKVEAYTGNFYIRVDAANSKWDNYRTDPDHLMTYSEYSITHGGYSHYYTHWIQTDDRKNIKFCIANDYSPSISDTLIRESNAVSGWENINNYIDANGDILRNANVRFMWNRHDNTIKRAYVDGAQDDGSEFLLMVNTDSPSDKIRWSEESALTDHKVTFSDNGNWIYEANIEAQPNAQIQLKSTWGTSSTITQYFKGTSSTSEDLVGGSGDTWYSIRVIYDFKTNRLVASYIPSGKIDDEIEINADVMFIREHQGDIAQLTFGEEGAISKIETAYGVLRLNKWTLNNKEKTGVHDPLGEPKSRYERDLFYVSFPFKVAMEDVFGFGTYGVHWIIEYYDGATRAANGYWLESAPNWKFVTNRKDKFFEPNQGYIIALDLDELGTSSSVWANTDQVELYFPSYGTMPDITNASVNCTIPEHLCSINRSEEIGGGGVPLGSAYDRRVKDSHWNVISVPTYVDTKNVTFANTDWITTATETSVGPNFLYEWNPDDNSVTARSGVGYTYKAMHAYLVQYCGKITWTSSVSPAAAPHRNPAYRGEYEFRLELQQNDVTVDQTYVKLSDNEHVTTGFEFNYDLSKEFNANKSNIYTLIGTEQVAGNVLPLTEQTTVIPVGVKAVADGDYTFSMPDGTEGIRITLIDNETGIRTQLSALDYTISLSAGTYDERFVLEISPIKPIATGVEQSQMTNHQSQIKKVLIDGLLYIVKDGKMFDARGAVVK